MKKLFLLLIVILTLSACSASEPQPMAGGIYTAEFDSRGDAALVFALDEMGLQGSAYQVSLYKKQIVNGINHFFVARVDGVSYEITVYESLNGVFQLTSHKEIQR